MKTYIARVYKDPHSAFGVSLPDLPGCYGAGESYDEALENAKISLREYAQALADDGDEMPKPRTHSELMSDATEAVEFNNAAFIAEIPLVTVGSRRRVNVSLDDKMLAAIDHAAKIAGVNRSVLLSEAASQWISEHIGAVVVKTKKRARRTQKTKLGVA